MRLPDKKRPGNPVLASDWNLLLDAIAARTPRPSPGLELVQASGGFAYRMRRVAAGDSGSAPTACRAFYATEVREVSDVPHLFLVTGQVMGGEGNLTPEIDLGAIDEDNPPDDGFVWLEISGEGEVVDDVLLPGFEVQDAEVGSGAEMPSNTVPTANSPSGTVHVLLGEWHDGEFRPVRCGNIQVGFCPPSSFQIQRP